MKKHLFLLLGMALLSAMACRHKEATLYFKLNEPFALDQGNTTVWEEDNAVQLRFEKVTADSRCPVDAECVWAGRVEVEVTFIQPGDTQTTTLILGDPTGTAYTDQAVFGKFSAKLLDVNPKPKAAQPIPQADYSITVEVKKEG